MNAAGLALGTYSGSVQITPGLGAAINVPVTFHVIPSTPVLSAVTPAEFNNAQFEGLNPPSSASAVTLTISGAGFVSGVMAWVSAFTPGYVASYPTTYVDSKTLQLVIPVSVNAGPISLTVSNPGAPQSNSLSLLEGKPIIGGAKVTGTVTPGSVIAIGGTNLGPLAPVGSPAGVSAVTTLGPTQVFFDGAPAQVTATYSRKFGPSYPPAWRAKLLPGSW